MAQNLFAPMTPEGAALSNLVTSLYGTDAAVKREERDALAEQRRSEAALNKAKIEEFRLKREAADAKRKQEATWLSDAVAGFGRLGQQETQDALAAHNAGGIVQPQPETADMPGIQGGYAMDPKIRAIIGDLQGMEAFSRGLPGKTNALQAQQALGARQNQNIIADVLAGLVQPQAASAAVAAGKGTPFFSETQGRVLDKFGGALNESGPQAVANVANTNAQAGERNATANLRTQQAGVILPNQSVTTPDGITVPVRGADISTQIAASMFGPRGHPQPKVTPGYREKAGVPGEWEPIPGGPADLKIQGAFNADTSSLQSTTSSMDRLEMAANELLTHPGLKGITGIRGVIPNIPGSDAANAQAKLNTLKSQVGFSVLQELRNASKTGGALGSVSDRENAMLQSNLASLENAQSYPEFQASLAQIRSFAQGAKGRLQEAYNMKHGARQAAPAVPPPPTAAPTNEPTATDALGNKIVFRNGQWQPLNR